MDRVRLAYRYLSKFTIAIHQYVATPNEESKKALLNLMWQYEDAIRRGAVEPPTIDATNTHNDDHH